MMTKSPLDDVKSLWRNQQGDSAPLSLRDVRDAAQKFERRIRRRNVRETLAAVVVVVICGWSAWVYPGWMLKLGMGLEIIASIFIMARLNRRGAARRTPADASGEPLLAFHRAELVRQRDLLKAAWLWYLGPLVPGMVLICLGRWFQFHARFRSVAVDHMVIVLMSVILALMFVIVGLVNFLAAARLQAKIYELDALGEEPS
jgi:hypothetical protein